MKIYNLFDLTAHTNAITADESLARENQFQLTKQGHEVQLWEGNLRTQGKNFCSFADGWKKIELPF